MAQDDLRGAVEARDGAAVHALLAEKNGPEFADEVIAGLRDLLSRRQPLEERPTCAAD